MKAYIKTRETILRGRGVVVRMVRDENGVVSFEYLIVAACIVAAVAAAFGGATGGTIGAGLRTGIAAIVTALTTAVAGA